MVLGDGRVDPGSYGTYRMVIKLPTDGETYGLSAESAMYAQRLFIDGMEYPSVGAVGGTAETSTPMSKRYTVFFTPQSESIEIIIQFANFVHADYGGITPLLFGSQQLIIQRDAVAQQRVHVFVGCPLTIFLFFRSLFLFFPRRYAFLWFALANLATAVRILIVREIHFAAAPFVGAGARIRTGDQGICLMGDGFGQRLDLGSHIDQLRFLQQAQNDGSPGDVILAIDPTHVALDETAAYVPLRVSQRPDADAVTNRSIVFAST